MFRWIQNQSLHLKNVLMFKKLPKKLLDSKSKSQLEKCPDVKKLAETNLHNTLCRTWRIQFHIWGILDLTCSIETGSVSNESNMRRTSKPPSFLKYLEDRNLCKHQIEMNISDLLPLRHQDTSCFVFLNYHSCQSEFLNLLVIFSIDFNWVFSKWFYWIRWIQWLK